MWIGWPGITSDKITKTERKDIETELMSQFKCIPVFLSQNDIEKYYHGFCNKTLWPICHYFTQFAIYDKLFWESYKRVNRLFS
jgi:trehalose 6-phosphate synthase/phosphatase